MNRLLTTNEETRSMITNPALTNPSNPGSGKVASSIRRRALIGGAMAALLASPGRAIVQGSAAPSNPFSVLLKGIYTDVVHAPNLSLSSVNLDDGSYSETEIYPNFGLPGSGNADQSIGSFFAQLKTFGQFCAYQLLGGALAMRFTGANYKVVPDRLGGFYIEGTFELTILEATGIYRSFAGGHNHMVDKLHRLADGRFDEFCYCYIYQP